MVPNLKLLLSDIQPQYQNLKFTVGIPEPNTVNKEHIHRVKNIYIDIFTLQRKLSLFSLFESKVNDMCANLLLSTFSKFDPGLHLSDVEFLSGYKLMPLYVPAMEDGGATHL